MKAKRCTGCGKTKLLSEFHKQRTRSMGCTSRCKTCTNGGDKQNVSAVCVSCPNDEIGIPMFNPRATFGRIDFRDMVFRGYLPDGSVWMWAEQIGEAPIKWSVDGNRLREVAGLRTIRYKYREVIR